MQFDLSAPMLGLEGRPMNRQTIDPKYEDAPLTMAWTLAHVLSVAVEDLNVYEQQAAHLAASANAEDHLKAAEVKLRARQMKRARGELAMRLLATDAHAVDLSVEECKELLDIAAPRLMPIMLAQVMRVIN